jgi:hypothetical protein
MYLTDKYIFIHCNKLLVIIFACIILILNSETSANTGVSPATQEDQFLLRVPVPAPFYINSEVRMSYRFYPDNVEVWKDIKGWTGIYQCSTFGRVRSLDRMSPFRGGLRFKKGVVLKPSYRSGYPQVCLRINGTQIARMNHRLVLETFDRNKLPDEECRHLDGIRTNPHISNLKWGTYRENRRDMVNHGRSARGDKGSWSKLKPKYVRVIRKAIKAGKHPKDVAKFYNVSPTTIFDIKAGRTWRWLK